MTEIPGLMPLYELMAAAITPEDLDFEVDSDAQYTLEGFEVAWRDFMKEHPELVPEGKREDHIKEMQEQAQVVLKAQVEANDELQKQLKFFEKSREDLEHDFEKEFADMRSKQKKTKDFLQNQLDNVVITEHLLSQVLPWEHFLTSVDKAAENERKLNSENPGQKTSSNENPVVENDKKAKPSARAIFLVDSTKGDKNDVQLRAHHIDHALLTTQVQMLQKEAEAYEKLLETHKIVGKFLNDQNVWSMVTKPSSVEAAK